MEPAAWADHTPNKRARIKAEPTHASHGTSLPSTPAAHAGRVSSLSADPPAAPSHKARPSRNLQHQQAAEKEQELLLPGEPIVMMMLDVEEDKERGFFVWGKLHSNPTATVLVRIRDFAPYWCAHVCLAPMRPCAHVLDMQCSSMLTLALHRACAHVMAWHVAYSVQHAV